MESTTGCGDRSTLGDPKVSNLLQRRSCQSQHRRLHGQAPFSLSPLGALHEHPAVAFQVLRAVEATIRRVLRGRKNSRTSALRALIMGIDAINVHKDAIDYPRHRQTFANSLISFATGCGVFITGRPARQHNHTLIGFHLRVSDPSIGVRNARSFSIPECSRQPIQRRDTILIRQHRNHTWILVRHNLQSSLWPGRSS